MTNKLICMDQGHDLGTAGKRTPKFPANTPYDGEQMLEYHFNDPVVKYAMKGLQYHGFDTFETTPDGKYVAPTTRTGLANNTVKNPFNRPADLCISVHANAYLGTWGDWGGTSSHIYTTPMAASVKLGDIMQKHLLVATGLRNRGVKRDNFFMVRDTKMPAVLIECAFMDNLQEALLLMDDNFRKKCADSIVRACCEYFGVAYKGDINLKGDDIVIGTGIVTATSLNVRNGASATHTILGTLSKDAKVNILSKSGEWYKIEYKTGTGFVHGGYVTFTATQVQYEYYTVVSGDILSRIAVKFNTTTDALVKLNNIANASLIFPGQKLKIREIAVVVPTPTPQPIPTPVPQPTPVPVPIQPTPEPTVPKSTYDELLGRHNSLVARFSTLEADYGVLYNNFNGINGKYTNLLNEMQVLLNKY